MDHIGRTLVPLSATRLGAVQSHRPQPPKHSHPPNGKLYLRDQDLIYCYDVKVK